MCWFAGLVNTYLLHSSWPFSTRTKTPQACENVTLALIRGIKRRLCFSLNPVRGEFMKRELLDQKCALLKMLLTHFENDRSTEKTKELRDISAPRSQWELVLHLKHPHRRACFCYNKIFLCNFWSSLTAMKKKQQRSTSLQGQKLKYIFLPEVIRRKESLIPYLYECLRNCWRGRSSSFDVGITRY